MIAMIPAVSLTGIPATPVAIGSAPVAMLMLLGAMAAAVLLLRIASRVPRAAPTDAGRLNGYLRFLVTRDGAADLPRHRLTQREAFFAALEAEPLRSRTALDTDAFRRNLRRRRPEAGLDPRLLWLLASAKANQAERFGVAFAELYGRIPSADENPLRVHVHLQETYHTRILADVVALFGVAVDNRPPPLWTRGLIQVMVFAPPAWVLPLIGCSEMAGCVIFRVLRDRGLALFGDEPAVAERVRLLYDEILADELSHVGFIAAQLGPRGRALMRLLYRRLSTILAKQMPELAALFGRKELAQRFRDFRHAALLEEYPSTAYAAAVI